MPRRPNCVRLLVHHFKTSLALVSALTLAASAFAQKLETPKVAEKGGQGKAGAPIEQNPDFSEAVKRFQTDFGVTIQLARGDEAVTAQRVFSGGSRV